MGGCRCSYGQCTNSSYNSPNTHFFHYPVKDRKRCAEWVRRANDHNLCKLPEAKLKNKVICDKHFNIKSFMNYRRDKLLFNAVPEIENNVIDTNINLLPSPVKNSSSDFTLPEDTKKDDTTKFIVTDRGSSGLVFTESENKTESPNKELISPIPDVVTTIGESTNKIIQKSSLNSISNRNELCKSFNKSAETVINTLTINKQYTASKILDDKYIDKAVDGTKNVNSSRNKILILEQDVISNHESSDIIQIVDLSNDELESVDSKCHKQSSRKLPSQNIFSFITRDLETSQNDCQAPKIIENHLKVEFNCSDDNVRSYANDLNDEQKAPSFSNAVSLKSEKSNKLDLLKIKNNSMKPSAPIGHISNMKKKLGLSNHMTKEQLLIGIKKYVSPSMAVLLQMELFGTLDRVWQQDEKQLSIELHNFGEDVYAYMTDELRWRLPSPSLVNKWKMEESGDDMELALN